MATDFNSAVTTPTSPLNQAGIGNQPVIGKNTGRESSLSNWAGPYVTDILGKAQAVADRPYQAYTGPLTAGPSTLQRQAFQGVGNLTVPTEAMGAYTPETFGAEQARQYMNPYVQQALQPQLQELQRQQDMKRVANAGRMTSAGSYGGGRQAVMESELDRAGLDKAAQLTGLGYLDAYKNAQQQFNTEQDRQRAAQQDTNTYGLDALRRQAEFGGTQRAITESGVAADRAQFEMERADPQKQLTWQNSLLQGLPLAAQTFNYAEQSDLMKILSGAAGVDGKGGILDNILGGRGATGGSGTAGGTAGGTSGITALLQRLFGTQPGTQPDPYILPETIIPGYGGEGDAIPYVGDWNGDDSYVYGDETGWWDDPFADYSYDNSDFYEF